MAGLFGFRIPTTVEQGLVGGKLSFEIFEKRFKIFIESIDRHYRRMGIVPQWGNYRLDLSSTKYEAFIKTTLRNNLIQLNSDLELIRLLKEPKDVQEDFLNNAVDLKPNFFGLGLNINYIISKIKNISFQRLKKRCRKKGAHNK